MKLLKTLQCEYTFMYHVLNYFYQVKWLFIHKWGKVLTDKVHYTFTMCTVLCSALSDNAVWQCCATVLFNSAVLLCCATVLCYSAVVLCFATGFAVLCHAVPWCAVLWVLQQFIKSWIISTVMSFNFLFFLFSYVPAETLCCYCNVPLNDSI